MTETAELSPLIKQGQIALREGASLAAVAAAMLVEMPEVEALAPAAPTVPAPVELTPEVKQALEQMAEVFAAVQPTERRTLTDTEVAALYLEREVVKQVSEVLAGREENIKEYVRNHMDVVAEETGRVDANTPRDNKGHYVVATKGNPERLDVAGTNQVFSREFRSGKASVDGSRLLDMYEAGEISREDYLAFTREVRAFDEDKAMKAINDDPKRLEILARLAVPAQPSTALFVRKAK
jgi:hypothetical protein